MFRTNDGLTGNWPTTNEKGSFECFVFPEIGDGQTERVDRDEFVRHVGLEDENEIGGVERAL